MEDGSQGRVVIIEGTINGYRFVDGTVTYWRDAYGHVLAVEVSNSADTAVIPWRNVAAVVTEPSERGGMADAQD